MMGKEVAVKQKKGRLVEAMAKDGPEDLLRVNDAGEDREKIVRAKVCGGVRVVAGAKETNSDVAQKDEKRRL